MGWRCAGSSRVIRGLHNVWHLVPGPSEVLSPAIFLRARENLRMKHRFTRMAVAWIGMGIRVR